ncbi:MAG TPA: chloride channel protein [Thermoleophilaceae bacterium]|nr:chloride channel protein [Thermoleophilaceae bacterium]
MNVGPVAVNTSDGTRTLVGGLVAGALIGVPAAAAAAIFESVLHGATTLVWNDVPDWFGWQEPSWWYVVLVPALAGVIVALALRLPGHGGHSPLQGLSMEQAPPINVVSVLAVTLIALAGGIVLGPEAPLLALGLTVGVVAARALRATGPQAMPLALAGAFAAMAGLFGGPLPVLLFFFEAVSASGRVPAAVVGRALLPGFVAAGVGSLVFTGVAGWPGVHEQSLGLPGLPDYPTVHVVDILWSLPVAAIVAVAIASFRPAAAAVAARWSAPVLSRLVVAGLAIGSLAAVFRGLTDRPVDFVLFSGQAASGDYIAEGSAGVLLAVLAFKGAGYLLSLASGFRGGPIFPAISLGCAAGVLGSHVLPGFALTPAAVAGIAAGSAAVSGLPFFGAVLATLLAGSVAAETAPIAILAAVTAWLVGLGANNAWARQGPDHPDVEPDDDQRPDRVVGDEEEVRDRAQHRDRDRADAGPGGLAE